MNLSLYLPKISVVTPSYNQGKYIHETIQSVISQKYPNLEFIIIDGGSTDNTVELIKEYEQYISYWVSEPDDGQSDAINKGFSKATGEIFTWLNSDDQFAPGALMSVAIAFLTSEADMVAGICEVYKDYQLLHRHLTSCGNGTLPLQEILDLDNGWNAGQFFYQPEVFFKRELWKSAGGHVRTDLYYSMDYELWCRFALNGARIHVIGAPIVYFRQHQQQKTTDVDAFKKELVEVRDDFIKDNKIAFSGSSRPAVNWTRKMNVALVNNLGYLYGAGIAHMRIAGAFEQAGHIVSCFDLLICRDKKHYADLVRAVDRFKPDIVIFGNIHENHIDSFPLLQKLEAKYPCFWLTHDFWLLTGRCGYPADCRIYPLGCDAKCPTSRQYPILPAEAIKPSYSAKQVFVKEARNLTVLANSSWSKQVYQKTLTKLGSKVTVQQIRLGVPVTVFRPLDKAECRTKHGIVESDFVLAFSVSSLSDERKGGALLQDALKSLEIPNLTLLVIGYMDKEMDFGDINIVSLSYVHNPIVLNEALNCADIYVGPSTEETFGQTFIEAAAAGVPSVGFDNSGVKDAIFEGFTGEKVKTISADALAEKIIDLHHAPARLAAMAKTAPIFAHNEYSIERSYASFFSVFREMGIVDLMGVAHKLSFKSTSKIISEKSMGWREMSLLQKNAFLLQHSVSWLISKIPPETRNKITRLLPERITQLLLRWLT